MGEEEKSGKGMSVPFVGVVVSGIISPKGSSDDVQFPMFLRIVSTY